MALSRRAFLTWSGLGIASVLTLDPLRLLSSRLAQGKAFETLRYGPLLPDPQGILDLPEGFAYKVISRTGDPMSDGHPVPGAPDGMAAFAQADGSIVLVCNHELSPAQTPAVLGPNAYDRACPGGTTTLVVNRDRQLVKQYSSLVGTCRNCAGGPTPWGSWISCEEDVSMPGQHAVRRPHGYNFEVPASAQEPVVPEPLRAMGRFNHEAVAIDPKTGIVYQTEDRVDGLFYRFIPQSPENLAAGGRLEALKIRQQPQAITRTGFQVGQSHSVEWVAIDQPDPPTDTVRQEGFQKGAAQFSRGEGLVYADGSLYLTCTDGGPNRTGQIWRYLPGSHPEEGGTLSLFVEPNQQEILDFPDNITVAPFGDLFVCEDGASDQYLRGVDAQGHLYPFARNALNNSEFAGVCFSTDPLTMFVNLQHPGLTLAIWGEFERRPA
ncbi:alkaline phosphatase PhoX [Lyngbya confervoides]|uniref:PhoX family protein n=1 Tax=Lyngbya confervoides BDU141951 TaxID=1574623 RepID=A0ABD4T356_9CYAN|nr:alkaline phosphatase PhoX [Lyngbya confervoides]MCM1982888.1 PhoX family protein [Lyngbya confervoides BDU141951]